jgi:hypothetical protein
MNRLDAHFVSLSGRRPSFPNNQRRFLKPIAEAIERLSRAIEIDPTRAVDKVKLEQLKAGPAQSQRSTIRM